jgi:glycosyltransferase involved in cell wall biosynthesis
MKKISIITICLNEEERIESTIKSIIDQTYNNFELIVVDGGSTDETLNIIHHFSKHIDVLIQNQSDGVYKAMNAGIAASVGDYIYFMNGGDRFEKNNVLSRIMGENASADILYGNLLIKSINGDSRIKKPPAYVGKDYLSYQTLPHPASLVKRDLFMTIGTFDESYTIAGDYDFFLRAIVKSSASTSYFPFTFAAWVEDGISSIDIYKKERESERKRAQKTNLPYYYYLIARKRYYFPKKTSYFVNKITRYKQLLYKLFR